MKYLVTERDRRLVQRFARQEAAAQGLHGKLRTLRADALELAFWQRFRALDDAGQAATFQVQLSSNTR